MPAYNRKSIWAKLDPSSFRLLANWHALTYEALNKETGKAFILRITDNAHRTPSEIDAELEWMTFSRHGGIPVPAIIPSLNGNQSVLIEQASTLQTAVVFEKLHGRPVAPSDWNEELFTEWGKLVGDLHRHLPCFSGVFTLGISS